MIGSLFLFDRVSSMYCDFQKNVRSKSRPDSDAALFVLDAQRMARKEFRNEDFAWRDIMTTEACDLNVHIKERLERCWRIGNMGEFGPYSKLHEKWIKQHPPKRVPEQQLQAASSTGF